MVLFSHNFLHSSSCTGAPFLLSEEEVGAAITEALKTPLLPLEDKTVPTTLLSAATVQALVHQARPSFVESAESNGKGMKEHAKTVSRGVSESVEDSTHSVSGGSFPSLFGDKVSPSAVDAMSTIMHGVVQRQLSNGMKVNLKSLDAESQRVSMRLYIPGDERFALCEEARKLTLRAVLMLSFLLPHLILLFACI